MIGQFLTQTLTRKRLGTNTLGKIITTATFDYQCRHEKTRVRRFNAQGEYYEVSDKIYVLPTADIKVGDRITVNNSTGEIVDRAVRSVFQANGFSPSHLEISL